jgi:hypothetical protein
VPLQHFLNRRRFAGVCDLAGIYRTDLIRFKRYHGGHAAVKRDKFHLVPAPIRVKMNDRANIARRQAIGRNIGRQNNSIMLSDHGFERPE